MQKTPDEIKKALEYCVQLACPLEECPYYDAESCAQDKTYDALTYIQQLETERHQLLTRCERLERERDALLEQVKHAGVCDMCKHEYTPLNELPCNECTMSNRKFEWRGVEEE